jgi:hypothetical protein
MAALRSLSLFMVVCTPCAPEESAATGTRCGSAAGTKRAADLALGAHLRAVVEGAPAGSAEILSDSPVIVALTVTRSDDLRLHQLIGAQLLASDRDDGWYMSPNGSASAAITAALVGAVGELFDGNYFEPLQVVRNTGAHTSDHHQDFRTEDFEAPWGPRVLSAHLFLNGLTTASSAAAGGLHFPQAGDNPCGEDTPRELVRGR